MKYRKLLVGSICLALATFVVGAAVIKTPSSNLPTPTIPLSGSTEEITYQFSDTFDTPQAETAKLYTLAVPKPEVIKEQLTSIVGIENLEDYYQFTGEGSTFYYVDEQNATITMDTQNGFWSITVEDATQPFIPENLPSDAEAVQIATDYVKEHNLFDGDLGEPAVGHSYTGDELTGDKQNLDVTVAFYPSIEGHEVYGLYRIMIVVGNNGTIQKVFKQASPVKSSEEVPLKSKEEVIAEVMENPMSFSTTANGIDKGIITDCELSYYMDGVRIYCLSTAQRSSPGYRRRTLSCPHTRKRRSGGRCPPPPARFFASGNRLAKHSSGAVCSFTSARLMSAICPIKTSAANSPRSTCFSMDSHSAVRTGDLMLSGSTRIRFVPFSVGISCFFLRSTKPADTSFSSMAARVAGVPNPLRSTSSGISPAPAVSIAARRESSDKSCKVLTWIIYDFFQGTH